MSVKKFELKGIGTHLTVFNDKITIEIKGITGYVNHGHIGGKTIPMESIQSVQFSKGTLLQNGFIQFGIMGGKEMQGGVFAAVGNEKGAK